MPLPITGRRPASSNKCHSRRMNSIKHAGEWPYCDGGDAGGDAFCKVQQSSSVLKQFQARVRSKSVKRFGAYVIRGMTDVICSTKPELPPAVHPPLRAFRVNPHRQSSVSKLTLSSSRMLHFGTVGAGSMLRIAVIRQPGSVRLTIRVVHILRLAPVPAVEVS
jgi:hypothetical protein